MLIPGYQTPCFFANRSGGVLLSGEIGGGEFAELFPELFGEIFGIVEAYLIRNLGNGELTLFQNPGGTFHPDGTDKLDRGFSRNGIQLPVQMDPAHADFFAEDVRRSLASMYGEDALYKRESERIMTWLAFPQQRRMDLPIVDLPSAFAADRLSMQPDHYSYIPIVEERCRGLRVESELMVVRA